MQAPTPIERSEVVVSLLANSQGTPLVSRTFDSIVESRRSTRAFMKRAVSRSVVEELLSVASLAPSNSNTQPWKVDVLAGDAKASLTRAIMDAHLRDPTMGNDHFPTPLPPEFRDRQLAFGALFYGAYGIERGDADGIARMLAANYNFFGAPVGLIVSTDRNLRPHSWLDCGLFLQTLMLAARARGLSTCSQVVFAKHHATISRELAHPADRVVICGLSLGYSMEEAVINNVSYPRAPLSEFANFHWGDGETTAGAARAQA